MGVVLGCHPLRPPLHVGKAGEPKIVAVVVIVAKHLIFIGFPVIVGIGKEVYVALERRG